MIGTNTIILNQETLQTAVQEYLDKHITPNVLVEKIEPGWKNQTEPIYTVTVRDHAEDKPTPNV